MKSNVTCSVIKHNDRVFFRAARGQGVAFAVLTHESRALTEDKQRTAVASSTEEKNSSQSSLAREATD